MNKQAGIVAVLASLIFTVAAVSAKESIKFGQTSVTMGGKAYPVELASTYEQRAQGLMFRKELCDDCGMLFVFESPKEAGMWMRNTFIPLDVAFIDESGVITDIKAMKPHDLTSIESSREVLYALEMNQGWFAHHEIAQGDTITIKLKNKSKALAEAPAGENKE